ncbi:MULTISPECIES: hypothetical protein [unclassified Sphingobium]|uniref:hypothetical protein n=1 Tax=unclassified Sphingobium TaxID=2611147 RepID=UPI0035A6F6BF
MKYPLMVAAGALLLGACSSQTDNNQSGVDGSTINRADDATMNALEAPAPRSGSGDVPPNAPISNDGGNAENQTSAP